MRAKRARATVVIEYPEGILLTLMRHMAASLPGGGVQPDESPRDAAARELAEETGLHAARLEELFTHETMAHLHTVFWAVADGTPTASGEVDRLAYHRPGEGPSLSLETSEILRRALALRDADPERFPASSAGHAEGA